MNGYPYTAARVPRGLGIDWGQWNPLNATWADFMCAAGVYSGASCQVPAITTMANGGLNCAGAGWAGRQAECEALNRRDTAAALEIAKQLDPDQYRTWYDTTGGASDPSIPKPDTDWEKYAVVGAVVVGTLLVLKLVTR